MTEQTSLQQRLQEYRVYRKFEEETVKPFLEELWYLRVPAFTAVLSLIFFAGIDQTLEVYRVFALNPSITRLRICYSFVSIFLLSLFIWHSGVALVKRRLEEYEYDFVLMSPSSGKPFPPKQGNRLIVIAKNDQNALHFCIFNHRGDKVIDLPETDLTQDKGHQLESLKTLLQPYWNSSTSSMPLENKKSIIDAVTSITGHTQVNNEYTILAAEKYDSTLEGKINLICKMKRGICITWNGVYSVLCLIFWERKSDNLNIDNLNINESKKAHSKATALLWLPRIFGFLPLLALGFGLFQTIWNVVFGAGFLGLLFAFLIATSIVLVCSSCEYFWGSLLFLALLNFGSSIWLSYTTIDEQQCALIFNQDIGCQLSSELHLCFGILFTLLLSWFYFNIDEKIKIEEEVEKLPSLFPPSNSKDILFSLPVLVGLSSLWITTFSIFTFPLVTNESAKTIAIFFFLLLLLLFGISIRAYSWIFFFLAIILSLVFFLPPLAPYIGSIVIIALFLIIFVTLSSTIFYVGYKTRISFITGLLALALVFAFFNWNDNHRLRELELSEEKPKSQHLPLETQFNKWITSRQDEIVAFKAKNKEYPIYVVSAQGGGIFAAYHAASTLSRLQDLCPAFAHHVFAISGVSGGSLGATAFSSLINSEKPPDTQNSVQPKYTKDCPGKVEKADLNHNRGILENYAHQLLNQDFLSPVLAAGLFPDFFQRFWPFAIEDVDRARGLEYAFEQGWNSIWDKNDQKKHPNLLNQSYYDHWNPESVAPALVLNTTVVETGERLLLSPFTFKTPDSSTVKFPDLVDITTVARSKFVKECKDKNNSHINFRLSTAAFLSARFPFVTPVGWFENCKIYEQGNPIGKTRLADGGYFENSGFTTAFEIGQGLQEILDHGLESQIDQDIVKSTTGDLHKIPKIRIVYLALTDNSPLNQQSGGNDLFSPMNALYNSREARNRSIIEQAEYKIDGKKLNDDENKIVSKHDFRQFYLTHFAPSKDNGAVNVCRLGNAECKSIGGKSNFNLPLGWYLSKFSQNYIRDRIGNPIGCQLDDHYPNANNNHCIMESVIHELELTH